MTKFKRIHILLRNRITLLIGLLATVLPAFSQGYVQVTKNHEEYIMQQFTTMETGAGALTPRYYYNAFHRKYQRTANAENKQIFRLHMKARVADEKVYSDSIKALTSRRAKVEAQNIVDRSPITDMAWTVEKGKIEGKLDIFQKNINKIMPYGGTAEDYRQWKNIYNCLQTAIKITRESYQDLGRRKKEYMAIYRDVVEQRKIRKGDAEEQQVAPATFIHQHGSFRCPEPLESGDGRRWFFQQELQKVEDNKV